MSAGAESWYGSPQVDKLTPGQRRIWAPVQQCERVVTWVGQIGAGLVLLLALLTAVLIVINKGVGITTSNAFEELKWHIFGAVWLFGCGYCLRFNGHVRVDTLYGCWPKQWRALIDALALVCIALSVSGSPQLVGLAANGG